MGLHVQDDAVGGDVELANEYGSLVPAMTRSADRLILMDQMPCTRRSLQGSSSMLKSSGSWMSVTFCTLTGLTENHNQWATLLVGLGARGLVYHAMLADLVAEAVWTGDETGLPGECTEWRSGFAER